LLLRSQEDSHCGQELRDWIEECDRNLLHCGDKEWQAIYGWGGQLVGKKLIGDQCNCLDYYELPMEYLKRKELKDAGKSLPLDVKLLEQDLVLCAGICSLHTMHLLSITWFRSPGVCYYSYEQQLLFHVLRFHLNKLNNVVHHQAPLLARMMEIGLYNGWTRRQQKSPLLNVPQDCQTLLAAMYYSNVPLMEKQDEKCPTRYRLATEDIKTRLGFCHLAANALFPSRGDCWGKDPLEEPTNHARQDIVDTFDNYLKKRSEQDTFSTVRFITDSLQLRKLHLVPKYVFMTEKQYCAHSRC
jgi:hypothetical protein